jgi:hypothetical protein
MIIENKKQTFKIWLQKFFATVLFVPAILVIWFTRLLDNLVPGMEKVHYLLIACIPYFALLLYHYLLKPYFIFFTDNGDKIILRYYPINAFNNKKHSIEIPKKNFVKFETKKFFLGREKIILYRRQKNQIAKFPPISLSAMKKGEVEQMKRVLLQYSK